MPVRDDKPPRKDSQSATRSFYDRILDGIDSAVMMVAPVYGSHRRAARQLSRIADAQMSWYEATAADSMRSGRWLNTRLSADAYMEMSLDDLRIKCEELYRTFSFGTGAVDGRTDAVVGTGIHPQPRIRELDGVFSEEQAKQLNQTIKYFWSLWAPHAGGRNISFTELERLSHLTWRRSGDTLVAVGSKSFRDKPVPLHLNVIDPARLATPYDQAADASNRLGVIRDSDGDATGFTVLDEHPYDTRVSGIKYQTYDAEPRSTRPWALHLYDRKWPDQSRGVPWLAPMAIPARDYKDWMEAEIVKCQQAAHIGVIIGLGGNQSPLAAAMQAATGTSGAGERTETWQPGDILYRNGVDKVEFLNPNHPATTLGMFCEWQLIAMAAGIDWPFGWLVKDRRRASYSAGRLEEIDGGYKIRADQTLMCSRVLVPIYHEFVTQLVLAGLLPIDPATWAKHRHRILAHRWVGQPRPFVDPEKEVSAWRDAIENNMATLGEVLMSRGLDVDDVLAARHDERAAEEKLDIVPPAYAKTDDGKAVIYDPAEQDSLAA